MNCYFFGLFGGFRFNMDYPTLLPVLYCVYILPYIRMVIKMYTAQITMRMYGYFVKLTKPYTRSIIDHEKE